MSGRQKTVLMDSKEHTSPQRAAAFLRELADRVEGGTVILRQGAQEVEEELPSSVILEVSLDVKPKKGGRAKKSLEVEIEWYEGGDGSEPVEIG